LSPLVFVASIIFVAIKMKMLSNSWFPELPTTKIDRSNDEKRRS